MFANRSENRHRKPSYLFIEAINFELTYQCKMNCSHCFQLGLRQTNRNKWIETDVAIKTIKDAYAIGLIKTGLNFTGGDIFVPESNLPDLLKVTKSMNINVRVNTNGCWGIQDNIRIGDLMFISPAQVVLWLRKMNVTVLALSFDRRFKERTEWWKSTVEVIRACEIQGQLYQIILTGVSSKEKMDGLNRLNKEVGRQLAHLIPVEMEMIDMGGAAPSSKESLQFEDFNHSLHCLKCDGKGFYRPSFLHISPDGGVRSCMYAPGSGWLGNIYNDSIFEMLNNFKDNCVVKAFSTGNLSNLLQMLIEPFMKTYKSIKHPCTVAAVSSKLIEQYHQFKKIHEREPKGDELQSIHLGIARELNLSRNG